MAGMAEMAQLAAVVKYKRGLQCQSTNSMKPKSTATKEGLVVKPKNKNLPKPKQCRWRDLIANFVHKANKNLSTHKL